MLTNCLNCIGAGNYGQDGGYIYIQYILFYLIALYTSLTFCIFQWVSVKIFTPWCLTHQKDYFFLQSSSVTKICRSDTAFTSGGNGRKQWQQMISVTTYKHSNNQTIVWVTNWISSYLAVSYSLWCYRLFGWCIIISVTVMEKSIFAFQHFCISCENDIILFFAVTPWTWWLGPCNGW